MIVLFVASRQIGHMDFGGLGFVRLDAAFRAQGHETSWLSIGEQVNRLRNQGCIATDVPEVAQLTLLPIEHPADIATYPAHQENRIAALGRFLERVKELRPDLMIIDRLLVGAGLVADQLEIPYVAVGTPGGHWRFEVNHERGQVDIHPAPGPIESYRAYGDVLKRDLGWTRGELASGWLRSPYCNLHFMGRSFYGHVAETRTANILHHKPAAAPGTRIGISFGNQGNQERLHQLTEGVIQGLPAGVGINLFVGQDEALRAHFSRLSDGRDVKVHQWVDFSLAMPDLACLVFLGGVGSIWHCMDQGIPAITVPGHIGDQLENARRVAATGIGLHIDADLPAEELPAILERTVKERPLGHAISDFKAKTNYSDTMESFVERASRLAF